MADWGNKRANVPEGNGASVPESDLPEYSNDGISKADIRSARKAKQLHVEGEYDKMVNATYPDQEPMVSFQAMVDAAQSVYEVQEKRVATLELQLQEVKHRSLKEIDQRDTTIEELHKQLTTALDELHVAVAKSEPTPNDRDLLRLARSERDNTLADCVRLRNELDETRTRLEAATRARSVPFRNLQADRDRLKAELHDSEKDLVETRDQLAVSKNVNVDLRNELAAVERVLTGVRDSKDLAKGLLKATQEELSNRAEELRLTLQDRDAAMTLVSARDRELAQCRELNDAIRANEADQREGLRVMTKDRDHQLIKVRDLRDENARVTGVCNKYSRQIQHAARSFKEIDRAVKDSPDFWLRDIG